MAVLDSGAASCRVSDQDDKGRGWSCPGSPGDASELVGGGGIAQHLAHAHQGREASREYESLWDGVRTLVDECIAKGESDPDAVVAHATASFRRDMFSAAEFRHYYERLGMQDAPDGLPASRIIIRDGRYTVVPFETPGDRSVIELVADHVALSPRFDRVVELGSGFGRNLVGVCTELRSRGLLRPSFVGLELTQSGRDVTQTLASLVPGIRLELRAFDYYDPTFDFLDPSERVLFFTAHSIEQIPSIGASVFERMLEAAPRCECIHFEPVGWQTDPVAVRVRRGEEPPRPLLSRLFGKPAPAPSGGFPGITLEPRDLRTQRNLANNAARWSRRMDYNTDLWEVLQGLATRGRIEIEDRQIHRSGDNPFNPTSLVRWSSRGGASA